MGRRVCGCRVRGPLAPWAPGFERWLGQAVFGAAAGRARDRRVDGRGRERVSRARVPATDRIGRKVVDVEVPNGSRPAGPPTPTVRRSARTRVGTPAAAHQWWPSGPPRDWWPPPGAGAGFPGLLRPKDATIGEGSGPQHSGRTATRSFPISSRVARRSAQAADGVAVPETERRCRQQRVASMWMVRRRW
jgi:hypothetical protein